MDSYQAGSSSLPAGAAFVDAFVFDVNGIARGKRLAAASWPGAVTDGLAFSASALILDATGASRGPLGLGTTDGDPDAIADPVPGTLVPVPWAREGVAQSLLAMRDLWFDPRTVLSRVVARCREDGIHPVVACEIEFCLVETDAAGRPAPSLPAGTAPASAGHLCVQRIEAHAAFLHALHAALAAQGVAGGTLVSEYGPGQFELNLPHLPDPLLAADQAALLRRAAVGVAASLGERASFMAKPYPQHPGNGLHIHLSLADDAGRNRFTAPGGEALLQQAIGGMQALHADSMALFSPSFSAYRRYRAGAFVALESNWGENRRDVAFRIPAGAARRIEHRVAAADASPHLAMAAVLAAAHHGITRGLAAEAAGPVPRHIFAALDRLEHSALLGAYLGSDFPALFAALKRAEAAALLETISDAEYGFYL